MHFPMVIAYLFLLVPYALANGCHEYSDSIGCPTLVHEYEIKNMINNFCTNHLKTPISGENLTQNITVGYSWPGQVFSLPTYTDF